LLKPDNDFIIHTLFMYYFHIRNKIRGEFQRYDKRIWKNVYKYRWGGNA